jgi:hypothetical protein
MICDNVKLAFCLNGQFLTEPAQEPKAAGPSQMATTLKNTVLNSLLGESNVC